MRLETPSTCERMYKSHKSLWNNFEWEAIHIYRLFTSHLTKMNLHTLPFNYPNSYLIFVLESLLLSKLLLATTFTPNWLFFVLTCNNIACLFSLSSQRTCLIAFITFSSLPKASAYGYAYITSYPHFDHMDGI